MKKLLVVLLTVALTLSMVAVAFAADVTTSMGGGLYFKYNSATKVFDRDDNDNCFTWGNITAKVTEGNTWAKTFLNIDTWTNTHINGALHYAAGIDKIADVLSLSFSTKDQDLSNIGQYRLNDVFDDYKTDPTFNTYEFGNSAAAVIDTESFTFKGEAVLIPSYNETDYTTRTPYAVEAIVKFDGGKAYVAYKNQSGDTKDMYMADLGAEFKAGEIALKADVWAVKDTTEFQANAANGPWDATIYYNSTTGKDAVIGVGGNYKLTDKFTVGAMYFNETDARYEVYGKYQIGVIDLRLGYVDPGAADSYVAAGFHAGI